VATTALLAALDDSQRTAVSFAFNDDAQRVRWSNFPTDGFQRAGIRMGDLSPTQRAAVFAVLEATLSAQGYQQAQAIVAANIDSEPIDLAFGPGEDGVVLQPEGIVAAELSAEQQTALLHLIRTRIGIINDTAAAKRMAEIQANLAKTYFAWSGSTTNGSAAYWRIQGPTLVIEYAPQQQGGSAINHIHAMYRDPTNDYGVKLVG